MIVRREHQIQAATGQSGLQRCLASGNLLLGKGGIGRGIDQHQKAFRRATGRGVRPLPVLRAQIDGRVCRQTALFAQAGKLACVVLGEQDCMPQQGHTADGRVNQPGQRRQGACRWLQSLPGNGHFLAEQAVCQRARVAIEDHGASRDLFAAGQNHTCRAPRPGCDPGDRRVTSNINARINRQLLKRCRQPSHPALNTPDAILLHIGDQHQGRCGLERGASAIGRKSGKQLAHPRVFELPAQILRHRLVRSGGDQVHCSAKAQPARHVQR